MTGKKARVPKTRSAAAIERKHKQTGATSAKGYAIVVDGGSKAIGANIRSNDAAFAKAR